METQNQPHSLSTQLPDSNEELVESTSYFEKQPPVMTSVFRQIFVDAPKGLIGSVVGFFTGYFTHFVHGFTYLWKPSLRIPPFDKKDFREDSAKTFGLAVIATAILIFLIKQGVIPSDEELKEVYGNDVLQWVMEAFIFLIFGVAYVIMIVLCVLLGRFFRLIFRLPFTRKEGDVLFTYLNNSFFSLTVAITFMYRCGIQGNEVEEDEVFINNVTGIYLVLYFILCAVWSMRFAKLHAPGNVSAVLFTVISTAVFTLFFALTSVAITFFILGA